MFEEYYDRPSRIQSLHNGPGGPLLEGFAKELWQGGYAEITARRHIRAAEHFIYWTDRESIPISSLTEKLLERFDRHLDQCDCPGYGHSDQLQLLAGARLFLKHLRGAGIITAPRIEPTAQDSALFTEFCQWMREQRGTTNPTLYNYGLSIRDLLECFGDDPVTFDAQSLRQFVLEKSQKSGWAAAKKCTTALRMFLRFLIAGGKCAVGLEAAIPVVAHWRLSSLPRYVQPEEVERIINSCDLNSPVGRRDRAILLLLARLGLRAGDIVELRLGDIDWERAGIHVSGKGRRHVRLPLTQEVGKLMCCLSALALLFAPSHPTVLSRLLSLGLCVERASCVRAAAQPIFFGTPRQPPCCATEPRCRTSRLYFATVPSKLRNSTPN
jgi:integrase